MHGSVLGFFAYGALQAREVTGGSVLEIGSLDVNGSIRHLVEARGPARYVGVDIVDGPGVDAVLDCLDVVAEFGQDAFDAVVSAEMMEHAQDWQGCLLAMTRVLKPGGVLVITTRGPGFAYHHAPDHWRYTQDGFRQALAWLGLDPLVLMDDPEFPGVFIKARKPDDWQDPTEPLGPCPGVTPVVVPLKMLGLPMQPDGTGYYRFWQPWTQLQRTSGHLAVVPPPGQHQWTPTEDEVAEFDIVSQQRPGGKLGARQWRHWKGLTKLVFETDDDITQADTSLPHLLREETQAGIRECLGLADLVTCSTEPLAERLRKFSENVEVIPNYIHEGLLKLERPRRDRLTVCWAGGITHLQDLVMLQEPMACLSEDHDFDLHFLGVDYSPMFGGQPTRFTDWSIDVWDYYASIDGDIGVIPLADTPFNDSRSDVKALEYAALGIPVVASDVPAYREFIRDGETGFLVNDSEQWGRRVRDLLHDTDMREEMGAKAKALAASRTIQGNWPRWSNVFERLAGRPG
jgi:glycosyltransferase involved in cell wall biosynthesis/SAM-dependent methyltransferase